MSSAAPLPPTGSVPAIPELRPGLVRRLRQSAVVGRLVRCASVSVFTTVLSNAVLVALAGPVGMAAGWANIIANAVGTEPSYALNRRWVWRHDGSDLWRQVIPFWVLSFLGLALSTLTVSLTAAWADAAGLAGPARSVSLVIANVSAFAVLWVAQFLLLDKVLFRIHPTGTSAPATAPAPEAEAVDPEPLAA